MLLYLYLLLSWGKKGIIKSGSWCRVRNIPKFPDHGVVNRRGDAALNKIRKTLPYQALLFTIRAHAPFTTIKGGGKHFLPSQNNPCMYFYDVAHHGVYITRRLCWMWALFLYPCSYCDSGEAAFLPDPHTACSSEKTLFWCHWVPGASVFCSYKTFPCSVHWEASSLNFSPQQTKQNIHRTKQSWWRSPSSRCRRRSPRKRRMETRSWYLRLTWVLPTLCFLCVVLRHCISCLGVSCSIWGSLCLFWAVTLDPSVMWLEEIPCVNPSSITCKRC